MEIIDEIKALENERKALTLACMDHGYVQFIADEQRLIALGLEISCAKRMLKKLLGTNKKAL